MHMQNYPTVADDSSMTDFSINHRLAYSLNGLQMLPFSSEAMQFNSAKQAKKKDDLIVL